jgi:hypothetical protein
MHSLSEPIYLERELIVEVESKGGNLVRVQELRFLISGGEKSKDESDQARDC